MIILLKIVDFEKKIYIACNEIGNFIGFFKTESYQSSQNSAPHRKSRSQNFEFSFLLNFHIYYLVLSVFAKDCMFVKGVISA